jgi:hypothetical protein
MGVNNAGLVKYLGKKRRLETVESNQLAREFC